jgi:hypothetical protein
MLDAFTICGSLIPMAACQHVQPLPVPGSKWKADLDNSTIPKEEIKELVNNRERSVQLVGVPTHRMVLQDQYRQQSQRLDLASQTRNPSGPQLTASTPMLQR